MSAIPLPEGFRQSLPDGIEFEAEDHMMVFAGETRGVRVVSGSIMVKVTSRDLATLRVSQAYGGRPAILLGDRVDFFPKEIAAAKLLDALHGAMAWQRKANAFRRRVSGGNA